jgi:hypothetical protein
MSSPDPKEGSRQGMMMTMVDAAIDHAFKRHLTAVELRLRRLERAVWLAGLVVAADVALRLW